MLGPNNRAAMLKLLQRRLRVSEKEAEEGLMDIAIGMDKKPLSVHGGPTEHSEADEDA